MDDVIGGPPPYTTAVPPYVTGHPHPPYTATGVPYGIPPYATGFPPYVIGRPRNDFRYQATEFFKGVAELSVEFGKGCRDVVRQSILRDDSFIVRNFGGVCKSVCVRFKFLNRYLPEDRDPMHSWSVISVVFALVLAGIPGIKDSLLQEFGIRLVSYDLPGFGESDPHPGRNLESSAIDLLHLSYAVHITDKFLMDWILGVEAMQTWLHTSAFMVAPLLNPYEPSMNKAETRRTWDKWTSKRRFMYLLARKFPSLLPYFYRRSFLSGNLDQIDKWLGMSLGKRIQFDPLPNPPILPPLYKRTNFIEELKYQDFWKRDLGESVRQGNVKPFVEESVLQVSSWGFSISDLNVQKKRQGKGIMFWLKSIYKRPPDELTGFLGPIHIWQGMEDRVVPPSMSDYVHRILPGAMVHKLLYE
ncbi:putative alpha/beta hydrolase fold protein [Tanacetum coccineum]